MNMTLLLVILMLVVFIVIGLIVYYRETQTNEDKDDATLSLPNAIRAGDWNNSVTLKCSNIQLAYIVIGAILWSFAIFIAIMDMSAIKDPEIFEPAKDFVEYVTGLKALLVIPFAFILALLYFIYSRTMITWNNGVLIDDNPVTVLYFYIRKVWKGANFIYLQSASKAWIFSPTTSQDNVKFKNLKIIKKEQAFNEAQIKQLRINLLNAGAIEKKSALFTPFIKIGFLAFVAAMIVGILIFR